MLRAAVPVRAARLIAASAVAVSVTGTTDETALATISIPAGVMGLNGGLTIFSSWTYTTSANAKTLRTRLGGIAGTAFMAFASSASTATIHDIRRIRNRGSASSQVGSTAAAGAMAANGSAIVTGTIDTATAQDLVISGQLASAGETITLENYEVWLTP